MNSTQPKGSPAGTLQHPDLMGLQGKAGNTRARNLYADLLEKLYQN